MVVDGVIRHNVRRGVGECKSNKAKYSSNGEGLHGVEEAEGWEGP